MSLCRIGREELIERYNRGVLKFGELWTATRGAAKCVAEIAARGEAAMVSEAEAARRIESGCEMCSSCTRGEWHRGTDETGEAAVFRSWYCGTPLVDQSDAKVNPTCGCLVAVEAGSPQAERVVSLRVMPACAALLVSKQCTQGKW